MTGPAGQPQLQGLQKAVHALIWGPVWHCTPISQDSHVQESRGGKRNSTTCFDPTDSLSKFCFKFLQLSTLPA